MANSKRSARSEPYILTDDDSMWCWAASRTSPYKGSDIARTLIAFGGNRDRAQRVMRTASKLGVGLNELVEALKEMVRDED